MLIMSPVTSATSDTAPPPSHSEAVRYGWPLPRRRGAYLTGTVGPDRRDLLDRVGHGQGGHDRVVPGAHGGHDAAHRLRGGERARRVVHEDDRGPRAGLQGRLQPEGDAGLTRCARTGDDPNSHVRAGEPRQLGGEALDVLAGRGHHQMIDDPGIRQALRGPPQQAPPADLDERLGPARAQSGPRSRGREDGDDGAVVVRRAPGAGRGGVGSFGVVRGPPYVDSHVVSAGFARLFRRFRRGGQAAVPEDRTSSSLDSATSSAVFSASASSETRI